MFQISGGVVVKESGATLKVVSLNNTGGMTLTILSIPLSLRSALPKKIRCLQHIPQRI